MSSFVSQLKQRRVYRVAIGYAIAAWLAVQIAATVLPAFHASEFVLPVVIVLLGLGFPVALVLAWAFDVTPTGIEKTPDATGAAAAKNLRYAWALAGIGLGVAVIGVGAYWLWHYPMAKRFAAPAAEREIVRSDKTTMPERSVSEKSIAVLPFASLSEDKANAYFADGIQDEILTRLSRIADLKVISRTSTQQYQSKPGNLSEIAKQLGVAHILEGSVQKAGDAVRVNVQLIKAQGDSHLWADTYDRKLTDIFAVETEVAQRIASSLEARLTGREQQQIAVVPTKNPQAYDAYLQGLALLNRQSADDLRKAREFFQQAVELDPGYAQAWSQLSIANSELYFGDEHTAAALEHSRQTAETAVRLQPDLGEAHIALASFYYYCLQDFERALLELDEARQRSPNNADVIFSTGLVKRRQGKLDEAIALQRQATSFDPRNPDIWANLGRSYRGKRDFRAAREMFDRAIAISPDETALIDQKTETFFAEGNLDAAENLLREQMARAPAKLPARYVDFLVYRRRFNEAAEALAKRMEETKSASQLRQGSQKSWLGSLKMRAGHGPEGRALLEEARRELMALREKGNTAKRLETDLLLTSADLGDAAEVERTATEILREAQRDLWSGPGAEQDVALAYALLGDADRAIPLLRHCLAVAYQSAITPALLQLDPAWDKIRSDSRFQELAAANR